MQPIVQPIGMVSTPVYPGQSAVTHPGAKGSRNNWSWLLGSPQEQPSSLTVIADEEMPAAPASHAVATSVTKPAVLVEQDPKQILGATPGCYALKCTNHAYHNELPGLSSTRLKLMLRSPAHYLANKLNDEDSSARRLGRAAHALLLTPDEFEEEFAVYSGKSRAGAKFEEFGLEHAGKDILLAREYDQAQSIAKAARSSAVFPMELFLRGVGSSKPPKREFTVYWTDEETGLLLKCRFDAIADMIVDLKTCIDARPKKFERDVYEYMYDLSAAMYMEGAKRFYGRPIPMALLAVEKDAPHGSWLHNVGQACYEHGYKRFRYALRRYAETARQSRWSESYGAAACSEISGPPPWLKFSEPQ